MKPWTLAVFLMMTGAAFGQAMPPPDLTIVPHGFYARGRVTTFSVMLADTVEHLSDLTVTITDGFGADFFVGPKGQPLIEAGDLLTGTAVKFQGVPAGYEVEPGSGIFSVYARSISVGFSGVDVSGPGELFRLSLYAPLYYPFRAGTSMLQAPTIEVTSAKDVNGIPLVLQNPAVPVLPGYFRSFGDLNGDGSFDLKDVTLLLQAVVGLKKLDEAQMWYADVAPTSLDGKALPSGRILGDGKIDLSDAVRALQVVTRFWHYYWPPEIK